MRRKDYLLIVTLFFIMFLTSIICSCAYGVSVDQAEIFVPEAVSNNSDKILVLIQIISYAMSMVCLVMGIISLIKKKKSEQELEKSSKEKEKLEIQINKNKNKIISCFTIAIIMFGIGFILYYMEHSYKKPIIYLYPEEETKITVTLGNPESLTCSYPKYNDNWEVVAKPNGDLTDLKTGRNLYSLYWEGNGSKIVNIKEGFCIKSEDTAKFLEEKLAILGLNEREAEEFIVYWLPELEQNKYNLIRFETMEEINNNMPLEISPKPDTLIRIMMEFKASNKYVDIPEQKLETPERNGFVVVEWGGIKN